MGYFFRLVGFLVVAFFLVAGLFFAGAFFFVAGFFLAGALALADGFFVGFLVGFFLVEDFLVAVAARLPCEAVLRFGFVFFEDCFAL